MSTDTSGLDLTKFTEDTLCAIASLREKKADLSAQADRLNSCIERFEAWIATIPGRVETSIQLAPMESHPDLDIALILQVAREGKKWTVHYGYWNLGDEEPIEYKSLREASINLKMYLIPSLPTLVLEMAKQQEKLTSQIDEIATAFDVFADQVGMRAEGKKE